MTLPVAPSGIKLAPDPETDRRFMAAAIALGRRNNGRAWPNPSVGAIVVRPGAGPVVLARGTTAPGGRPHAEALALKAAGDAARGATVYVTLEPCAHHGRTPPCSEALVAAGVGRVVTALEDPDPRVAGRGHDHLRRHGIAVTTGVLAPEASRLHAGHLSRIRRGRPHVALKLAVSADGCIGRVGDGQVAISSPLSKAYAHGLRLEHDAIMVGVGTVLADDPELTCRLPGCESRSPIRIVIDGHARTPLAAKLVTSADAVPTWIFVAPDAPAERIHALGRAGVSVLVAERDGAGRVDLADVLFQLGRAGITSVVTEGGSTIARTLVETDLIDEAHIVEAPLEIGEGGVPALAGLPLRRLTDDPDFEIVTRRRLGPDRLVHVWRKDRT
jgi:diaminohydroxyphosphoribosylaminopyrimidine deaminase/5-amino-6-(5-phosphoribosylamino)uracil reductase